MTTLLPDRWDPWLDSLPPGLADPLRAMMAQLQPLLGLLAPLAPDACPRMRCVAMFDAGPGQPDAARVLHMALFILLARRARAARMHLRWGVLQAPGRSRFSADEHALGALLTVRAPLPAGQADLDGWNTDQASHDAPDDFWQIGGAGTAALARMTARVTVAVAPDGASLQVTLARQGGVHALRLALPQAGIVQRLVRHPVAALAENGRLRTGLRDAPTPEHAPHFGLSDTKVLASRFDGGTLEFSLHHAFEPHAGMPVRRRLPKRGRLAGQLLFGGRAGLGQVALSGESMIFNGFTGEFTNSRRCPLPPPAQFQAPGRGGRPLPTFYQFHDRMQYVFMLDGAGRLLEWSAERGQPEIGFRVVASGGASVAQGTQVLGYASVAGGKTTIHAISQHGDAATICFPFAARRVLFGEFIGMPSLARLAVQVGATQWLLAAGADMQTVEVDEGATVIALVRASASHMNKQPALLVLSADRQSASLCTATLRQVVLVTGLPMVHLVTDQRAQLLCWMLAGTHELCVRALHGGGLLLHVIPDQAALPDARPA
ncbi:hypothetical protein F2P45_09085 [Massilia sp. CCM 8733]|uniref:Uncharacterized protein n=1 Tax=Massilia mucilaginosa TaxID=2609282 RepID=A0ABX0NQM1_9BURK|nr:hypothetical protein [Massilia mucilaginosa]NHZ89169.1 hypothetical protein [Massilia mucilaginosa]